MLPVEEILEALDLSRAQPGVGFLQALFERFNARVPFENASKILRNRAVADPREKPRWPGVFWADHLEKGAGGTCFARVAAFDALLNDLGFSTRKVLGRVERDFDHAALVVREAAASWICDVGFPLPALLPAGEGRIDTTLAEIAVGTTSRGYRIEFLSGVPDGPRALEIFGSEVPEEEFRDRWRETFASDSKFLSGVVLRRQEASRVLSFARGQVRVDDRHSRLQIPLPRPRAGRLAEIFEIDAEILEAALAAAGDPDSWRIGSRITAYLETPVSPQAAFEAIGSWQNYRRLIEGVAAVTAQEETAGGWRLTLEPPSDAAGPEGAKLVEEGWPEPARRALRLRRTGPRSVVESELRVEERAAATYLVREAAFETTRDDLLRNDSLRGRLAGSLAVDLLAWARLLRSEPATIHRL